MGGFNNVAENVISYPRISHSLTTSPHENPEVRSEEEVPSPTVSAVTPPSPPAPVPKVKTKHANQYTAKNLLKCNQPGYSKESIKKAINTTT